MTLTLLLVVGSVVALSAVFVVATRPYEAPALAGENTVVGMTDPAADTLAGNHGGNACVRSDWHLTTVSALCDAEDLLDCLETQGYAERELVVLGNSCFAVRWR